MNWLTVKLLGKELVSKEELAELKNYGKLPSGDEVGLVERSFILGRVSALSNKSEYKDLTLKKLSKFQKRKFSSVEKLAIREAKLHTAHRLNALADSAAAGASARLHQVTQDLLSDATVKEIVEDELALALAEKKTRQQLASSIGNKLGTNLTSGFKKLMVTEMHRAKTRGIAMAIANKVDIYASSGGPESSVSVVPNRDACKDCHNLYLTDTGNPRIFKLKDLVAQGANSDEGVSHSRTRGYHMGWKPVMPPAHPNCFCELVYVPPGMSWEDGRLAVTDEFRYKDHISKAVDQSQLSAKTKPPGPEKTQGPDIPKPASIPGIAAPGNVAGPGRPEGSGAGAQAAPEAPSLAPPPGMEACPFGGGKACEENRGNGHKMHKKDGTIIKKHNAIIAKKTGQDPEEIQASKSGEEVARQIMDIGDYKQGAHSKEVQEEDLTVGIVAHRANIKDVVDDPSEAGISSDQAIVEKLDIVENGSGLWKGLIPFWPHTAGNEVGGSVVHETFGSPNDLGGNGRCAHTTYRIEHSQKGSIQGWITGARSGLSLYKKARKEGKVSAHLTPAGLIKFVLGRAKNKDKVRAELDEAICSDVIMNNNDRHGGNMMFNDDSAYAIDHGFSFGIGMNGYRNHYHEGMEQGNFKVRVPDAMREKINNTSFDQLHGSLSEHTTTWRAAQTYLRSHYLLHVEDVYGHIPYEEIGGGESHGKDNFDAIAAVRYDNPRSFDTKGNAAFEAFAFAWIDDRVADPSHPEHETAKRFQEEGIFMSTIIDRTGRSEGSIQRQMGQHLRYEKFARSHSYLMTPEAGKDAKALQAKIELRQQPILNVMMDKTDKIAKEIKPLEKEMRKLADIIPKTTAARQDRNAKWEALNKKVEDKKLNIQVIQDTAGRKLLTDKMLAVSEFVPPGKEELYKQLDSKIADIESGKKLKLDISLNTGMGSATTAPLTPQDQAKMEAGARAMVEDGKQLKAAKAAKPNAAAQAMAAGQQSGSADVDIPIQGQPKKRDQAKEVSKDTQMGVPRDLAAAVRRLKAQDPINLQTQDSKDKTNDGPVRVFGQGARQSPAALIESSKQVRAQEVALSHHGKMLKDAKRDLKRMKRGVPAERKAKLQGKVKALDAQYKQMQDKFDKLQGGK
jgi:hypothetical protein